MSNNNPFSSWGAPQAPAQSQRPDVPATPPGFPAPPAPGPVPAGGFAPPQASAPAPSMLFGHPAPGHSAPLTPGHAPQAPFGVAQPGAVPLSAIPYNPFVGYAPEIGTGRLRFPAESAFHLVQVTRLRLHMDKTRAIRQIVECRVVASTSHGLAPGQEPSISFRTDGLYANREKTDLLAGLAGYHKQRDAARIAAEFSGALHLLANLTDGAQVDWSNPASITLDKLQGPGMFAGRYVLVEIVPKPSDKRPGTVYINQFWHAVPQPPPGQSYTPEQVQAILARQYALPEPAPIPHSASPNPGGSVSF